jgi:hypothetical protein
MHKKPHSWAMVWRQWFLAGSLVASPLAAVATDSLQTPPAPPSLSTWLPQLRPGDWVKVEGESRPGGGILARKIKVMHGDFDETEVTAVIAGDRRQSQVHCDQPACRHRKPARALRCAHRRASTGSFLDAAGRRSDRSRRTAAEERHPAGSEIEIKKAKSAQKHDARTS